MVVADDEDNFLVSDDRRDDEMREDWTEDEREDSRANDSLSDTTLSQTSLINANSASRLDGKIWRELILLIEKYIMIH